MDYDKFVDLDNVTLQDCLGLYFFNEVRCVINDGKVIGFVREEED